MVGHNGYNRLGQDEHDDNSTLNHAGLDASRQSDGYADRPESSDTTAAASSRPGALQIDTGAPQTRARRTEKGTSSKKVVAWKDLPKKDQLLVITLARLSEPLTQTSLQVSLPPGTTHVGLSVGC